MMTRPKVSLAQIAERNACTDTHVAPAQDAAPIPAETPAAAPPKEDDVEQEEGDGEEGGPKVLSKKEKEKLKKEREKVCDTSTG